MSNHNPTTCACNHCKKLHAILTLLDGEELNAGLGILAEALFRLVIVAPRPEVALNSVFTSVQQELWSIHKESEEIKTATDILQRQQLRGKLSLEAIREATSNEDALKKLLDALRSGAEIKVIELPIISDDGTVH